MKKNGFTLIELSIVLVIIGLIVGGVLVGQNLISAAAVRAQISQIEKFNTATNTFYGKFRALPGDMDPSTAASFGLPVHLAPVYTVVSNDGLIEGVDAGDGDIYGQGSYETGQFWLDLSSSAGGQLIQGSFPQINNGCSAAIGASNAASCFPTAKLGSGNYIYVYTYNNANWYGLASVIGNYNDNKPVFASAITVAQANSIDQKTDDGFPTTGNVKVADTWSLIGVGISYGTQVPASPTSCYDNGNVNNAVIHYSLSQSGGAGVNCVLSFRFQ
jgi:prepilin-type N-terminal cleavage/methylation domain-containing protein